MRLYRFWRRLKHLFRFKEIWKWKYETCQKCGIDYRLSYSIVDDVWLKIVGSESGTLCFDCFLKLAQKKNIEIKISDIEHLWIFNPTGNCYDIIWRKQ